MGSLRLLPARKTTTMQMKEATVRTIGVAMQTILPSLPMLAVDRYVSRRIEATRAMKLGGWVD